jgi:hypothetical protein
MPTQIIHYSSVSLSGSPGRFLRVRGGGDLNRDRFRLPRLARLGGGSGSWRSCESKTVDI